MQRVEANRPNYLIVFGILAGFTLIETLVSYVQQTTIRLPVLLGLSAVKAALVLLYFMHLKMDSRVFSYLFIAGLVLAIPLILVMTIVMPIIARY
jgi:cytochrome c oxidase subunit 4